MSILEVLNRLQYGTKLQKLCYRILHNCIIQENNTLSNPACVTMSRKSIFIELNLKDPFFKKDSDIEFALMHEALHIAFGHMFIDTSLYNMDRLNISMDASIQPYLNPDPKKTSPVINHLPNTLYSGLADIYSKNTWEYIYNYFPMEDENNNDNTPEQTNQSNNNQPGESSTSSNSIRSNNDGGESENTKCDKNDISGMPKCGNSDSTQQINYDRIDTHKFEQQPSKAIETIYTETLMNAISDLQIDIGSALGQTIITGLNFYQKPVQKWKRQLSMSVLKATKIRGRTSTWLRPNRRMSSCDIPQPGNKKLYYPRIGVLVDSSGSMSTFVPMVLGHIANIATITGIDYLIGGDVKKQFEYRNVKKKTIQNIEFKGFGGTLLNSMILELSKKPIDILIGITDLCVFDSDIEMFNKVSKKIKVILCVPKGNTKYVKLNSNIQLIEIEEEKV